MYDRAGQQARTLLRRMIGRNVRLALAPPDQVLLKRYFEQCAGIANPSITPLTTEEQRWVTTNLEYNPSWQESWRAHEVTAGRPVSWRMNAASRSSFSTRPAMQRSIMVAVRRASWTAVSGLLIYAVLWLGGRASLPPTYYLASISEYEIFLDQQSRSTGSEAITAFSEAAKALLLSGKNTLGLFPYFDRVYVDRAARHLEDAYNASSDPFQRAEFAFFRAKASLMRDDPENAIQWLRKAEEQQVIDYRMESRAILEVLE